MELLVNNKYEKLLQGNTLEALLAQLSLLEKRGIAVAVNNQVISKTGWHAYQLSPHDKITIITPTQGG